MCSTSIPTWTNRRELWHKLVQIFRKTLHYSWIWSWHYKVPDFTVLMPSVYDMATENWRIHVSSLIHYTRFDPAGESISMMRLGIGVGCGWMRVSDRSPHL